MLVLGLETTCDETAAAIVKEGRMVLSNVISSQADFHSQYRGVFPEYASRSHVDLILPTLQKALDEAGVSPQDIDLLAVADRPGLMGPLLLGVNAIKALAWAWDLPFVTVNHLEAHLYAALMSYEKEIIYPAVGVVISGGHTFMVSIEGPHRYTTLAQTVDDALGEAFDKVAALLGLPYPGGPEIEKLALQGNSDRYPFKAGQVKTHPLHFSLSGLKTQVLYAIKGPNAKKDSPSLICEEDKKDIAASFQKTALLDIVTKAKRAAKQVSAQHIFFGGGVANNGYLKTLFDDEYEVFFPKKELTTDNGAMIAGLGYQIFLENGPQEDFSAHPQPSGAILMP